MSNEAKLELAQASLVVSFIQAALGAEIEVPTLEGITAR